MGYPFLSDSWFSEVARVRDELSGPLGPTETRINLEVSEAPWGGAIEAHYHAGVLTKGLSPDAPAKLKLSYEYARKFFLERDQGAAMTAFAMGKLKVEGDMMKLMSLQSQLLGGRSETQKAIDERIAAITD